tara:strand:- start:1457 stop:2761 length:1305 start_codon:yes stop_codon:yes gene_type:complete
MAISLSISRSKILRDARKIRTNPSINTIRPLTFKRKKDYKKFVKWISNSNDAIEKVDLPDRKRLFRLGSGAALGEMIALSALLKRDEIVEKGKNVHDWITDNLGFGNPWIGYSLAAGGLLTGGMLINKGVKSISNKIFNRTSKKVGKEVAEEVAEGAAKKTLKEAAEQTTKKATKEIGEKASKEVAQNIAEKGGKELVEGAVKEGTKEVVENVAEKGTKKVLSETAEKGTKKIVEQTGKKIAQKGVKAGVGKGLGMLPIIGNFVDLGMAGYRASQGDFTGAALSLGSAIPGPVGWSIAAADIARDVVKPDDEEVKENEKNLDAKMEELNVKDKVEPKPKDDALNIREIKIDTPKVDKKVSPSISDSNKSIGMKGGFVVLPSEMQSPPPSAGGGGGASPVPIPGKNGEVRVIVPPENEVLNSLWNNILLVKLSGS